MSTRGERRENNNSSDRGEWIEQGAGLTGASTVREQAYIISLGRPHESPNFYYSLVHF